MILVPDSWGVELYEFNPCHSSTDGTFAVKGQGRCLGDAARTAARREEHRAQRQKDDADYEKDFIPKTLAFHKIAPEDAARYIAGWRQQRVEVRRKRAWSAATDRQRELKDGGSLPAYMQQDAQRAWNAERVITTSHGWVPGTADANEKTRHVRLSRGDPGSGLHTKPEQLTVLRHELGHIDRTPLGKERLFGDYFSGTYTEEIRAWKNAIRNSKGRVDFNTVRTSLSSYMMQESPAAYTRKVMKHGKSDINVIRAIQVDKHINLLKRYARRIRKASRGL